MRYAWHDILFFLYIFCSCAELLSDSTNLQLPHIQEENKILEKTHRQKVLEVEKLSQTIQELEEAILSSAATANTIRDYRRQISELQVGISYGS